MFALDLLIERRKRRKVYNYEQAIKKGNYCRKLENE